jgi:hypothetical protein
MQNGMSAAQVADLKRTKQIDEENRLAAIAKAELDAEKSAADDQYKADQLRIQERQVAVQENSAERQDQREQRLLETQERALQEKANQDALGAARRGGIANIISRDAEPVKRDEAGEVITDASGTVPYIDPMGVQNWLGKVPFDELSEEQKKIALGYGQQMGYDISEVPSAYETERINVLGNRTLKEKEQLALDEKLKAQKREKESASLRSEIAQANIVADELETPAVPVSDIPAPGQAHKQMAPVVEEDDVIAVFGGIAKDDIKAINALKNKKPNEVVQIGETSMVMPPQGSAANIPAPGSVTPKASPKATRTAAAPKARTVEELRRLDAELYKYATEEEFMAANGIKDIAELKRFYAELKKIKSKQ